MHVLRCLTLWAKTSSSIGINMSIIEGHMNAASNAGGSGGGGGGVSSGGASGAGDSSGMKAGGHDTEASPLVASSTTAFLSNPSFVSPAEYNLTDSAKLRRTSLITINQNVLNNMMRTIGTGALSQNAHQQSKYFFDFQQQNSVILYFLIYKKNFDIKCIK